MMQGRQGRDLARQGLRRPGLGQPLDPCVQPVAAGLAKRLFAQRHQGFDAVLIGHEPCLEIGGPAGETPRLPIGLVPGETRQLLVQGQLRRGRDLVVEHRNIVPQSLQAKQGARRLEGQDET